MYARAIKCAPAAGYWPWTLCIASSRKEGNGFRHVDNLERRVRTILLGCKPTFYLRVNLLCEAGQALSALLHIRLAGTLSRCRSPGNEEGTSIIPRSVQWAGIGF